MERSNKKRVAHVGQHVSKKKCTEMNDVVSSIMKEMDDNIAVSGNQEFYEILKFKTHDKVSIHSNLGLSSGIINQPNLALPLPKRLQTNKRHSLMEKARKNINYIKHNRSLPKPRAHLSGFRDSVHKKKDKIHSSSSTTSSNLKTTNGVFAKSKQNKSNREINTFSVESDINKLSVSSSESESEFESFIQAQKKHSNLQNSSKCKKKKKPKTYMIANKQKTSLKRKKCSEVSLEIKSDNDESLKSGGNQISRNRSDYKIYTKLTTTNRLLLSDSSVASGDENDLSDRFFEAKKVSSLSIDKRNDSKIDQDNYMCSVRIERNPILEKTVTLLNDELKDSDQNNEYCSNLQGEKKNDVENEDILDSEDDCMIVYEVPKSDNTAETSVAKRGDPESDIQILNVVSLGECHEATGTDELSKFQSSSYDRNSDRINYEKLKEAIEITKVLESTSLKEETVNSEVNSRIVDSSQTVVDCDLKEACVTVPAAIIETINKIDFKHILSITNNESPHLSDVKKLNPLPCSSSNTDNSPSFARLPLKDMEVIAENDWQNLKKAVWLNYPLNELELSESDIKISNMKPGDDTNFINFVETPSTSSINSDLNLSDLKEILSNAEHLPRLSEENIFQNEDNGRLQIKKDYHENSSDEFDALAITSLQELCSNMSAQNFMKLLGTLNRTYHDYISIKNVAKNANLGLKMVHAAMSEKKRHFETVLEYMMKNDPCFYSTAANNKESVIKIPEKKEEASSEPIKMCVNCGKCASIECARCKMVSFCTEKCGVIFWRGGHYKWCGTKNKEE